MRWLYRWLHRKEVQWLFDRAGGEHAEFNRLMRKGWRIIGDMSPGSPWRTSRAVAQPRMSAALGE